MAKVKMLVGLASDTFSVSPGEPFECPDDEAQRLIDAGAAEAWTDAPPAKGGRKAATDAA